MVLTLAHTPLHISDLRNHRISSHTSLTPYETCFITPSLLSGAKLQVSMELRTDDASIEAPATDSIYGMAMEQAFVKKSTPLSASLDIVTALLLSISPLMSSPFVFLTIPQRTRLL